MYTSVSLLVLLLLLLLEANLHTTTTNESIYLCMYIYICVCVCVVAGTLLFVLLLRWLVCISSTWNMFSLLLVAAVVVEANETHVDWLVTLWVPIWQSYSLDTR